MVKEIDIKQLTELVRQGAELVDVREQNEFPDGALNGGKNWPLSSFGLRKKDISGMRPTIFYCRSGLRSLKAAEIASNWTDQELYSLHGGILALNAEDKAVLNPGEPSRNAGPTQNC